MGAVRRTPATMLLDLWVLILSGTLCLPVLTRAGYGLSGDLVFSPKQPLTLDTLGLGGRLARAVPLDAVVALLGEVFPGAVLFRVGVLAGLVLAGCGAHRLTEGCSVPARLVAASFAVWNPFTVERLALGQWALILAYGALFLVVLSSARARASQDWLPWTTWAWVGLASLTPTGGILATVTAAALAGGRRARVAVVVLGCCVLQLPWVLPSLLGSGAGVSDAAAVAAFRAQPDAPGGTLLSVLGLGGIWDLDSVPTSRTSALGVVAAVVVVAAVIGAWRRLPTGTGPLVPVALGGLVLAMAPRVPVLDELVARVVAEVPGGGLLRDSQKWVAPLVVLASVSLAVSLDRLRTSSERRFPGTAGVVAVIGVFVPFLLLPDATGTTWAAVSPVSYPREMATIRDRLAASPASGSLVLLPWRSYRRFEWGNPRTVHDPAYAWFDVPMVGSDQLVVGRRTVSDHDPTTLAVRRAAASPDAAQRLAGLGVGWALVYKDDPLAPNLHLGGFDRVVTGPDVELYRVAAATVRPQPGVPGWKRAVVVGLDLLVLAAWFLSCVLATRRRFAGTVRHVVGRTSTSEVS